MKIGTAIWRTRPILSILLSIRHRSVVLIGRGTVWSVHRNASLHLKRHSVVSIGIEYFGPPSTTVIEAKRGSHIIFNGNVSIKKGCQISVDSDATLRIGNNTFVNQGTIIRCSREVSIGDFCAVSWRVTIIDSDEHDIRVGGASTNITRCRPVAISNKVLIGCNCTILKGTSVADNVVIGAASLVTGTLEADSLYAGNPARQIGHVTSWT